MNKADLSWYGVFNNDNGDVCINIREKISALMLNQVVEDGNNEYKYLMLLNS